MGVGDGWRRWVEEMGGGGWRRWVEVGVGGGWRRWVEVGGDGCMDFRSKYNIITKINYIRNGSVLKKTVKPRHSE